MIAGSFNVINLFQDNFKKNKRMIQSSLRIAENLRTVHYRLTDNHALQQNCLEAARKLSTN